MGAVKHYLLTLITRCAPDNGFAQDAIEHYLLDGTLRVSGDLDQDVTLIMSQYDLILTTYRAAQAQLAA